MEQSGRKAISTPGPASEQPALTFLVDRNVGSLARRLRWLGYDAAADPGVDDGELVAWAVREGRVLLTRDRGILLRRPVAVGRAKVLWIVSDQPWEQLAQVVHSLGLDAERHAFSRCIRCNIPLEAVDREAAAALVPPYVAATQRHFTRCSSCRRLFWRGTHWQRMHEHLLAYLRDPGGMPIPSYAAAAHCDEE